MLLVYLISGIYFLETVFRISFSGKVVSLGMWYSLIFAVPLAIVGYIICMKCKEEKRYRMVLIELGVVTILFMSQFVYYKIFRVFYSLYSALNAGQVWEFWEIILITIKNNIWQLMILSIPIGVLVIFKKRLIQMTNLPYKVNKIPKTRVLVEMVIIVQLIGILGLHIGGKAIYSPYDLYYQHNYPIIAAEKLGLITTLRLDAKRMIFSWEPKLREVAEEVVVLQYDDEELSVCIPSSTTPYVQQQNSYNMLEIDFEELIALASREGNENLVEMHQYFKEVVPTSKNEYTGKYEGYNLILITAEGFSPYAIDQTLTPTLYQLYSEGYQFTNFYTPLWELSTSDGEYAICTGQIPKSGVWSMAASGENEMPFTLGNMLQQRGYKTMAFHNHTYDYYDRDISHPNMGYEYIAKGNGLEISDAWPESDIELMEQSTRHYVGQEPFHAYYMTVSGHMNYSFIENDMAQKNKALVDDLEYSDTAKAYLACNMELDRAIATLLDTLEVEGVLERTLIAITPDHYPYGLSNEYISELAGEIIDEEFGIYQSTFLLYTPNMAPIVIDKPCSSLDVLPTILNLMGLDYDSRLLAGRDIFSSASPLVMLYSRNFMTDKGAYNAITKEFMTTTQVEVDETYVHQMIEEVERRFYYAALVLEEDYYAYISTSNKE